MFPDLDLSSARVRTYAPMPPMPSVSGSRGGAPQTPVGPRGVLLHGPIVTGPRGVRRPAPVAEQVETPPRSSTRISLVRHPAPPPPQEDEVPTKKSKKGGKEKSKDKKGKSKSKAKKELAEEVEAEAGESDEGIMHPVDLVIHKKKRKGREHRTVHVGQHFNAEEMRETAARGFSVGPSGGGKRSSRAPPVTSSRRQQPEAPKVGAVGVTVLKKSRSDGGKRRPSHP